MPDENAAVEQTGAEVFFAKGDTLFAAGVTPGEARTGAVRRLFSGPYRLAHHEGPP